MVKIYGYKKCSTCVKAEKFLNGKNKDFKFIDITTNPPPLKELKSIFKNSGVDIAKLYNTSGKKYRELNIKEKKTGMSENEQLKMLSADGYLIKRPLVTDGKKATVGFKEDDFKKVWS